MNRILLRIADDKKLNMNQDDINETKEDDDINININMDDEKNNNINIENEDNEKENNNEEDNDKEDTLNLSEDNRSELERMIMDDSFDEDIPDDDISSPAPKNNMQNQLIKNIFYNLAQDGRGILKHIEDYKFKIIQSLNVLNGQNELKTKIEQKQKILESAAAQIYGIVFDLENYQLTPNYEEEQFAGEVLPTTNNNYNEDAFNNLNNDSSDEAADIDEKDMDADINEIDEQESKDLDNAESTNETANEDIELQGGFDEEELTDEEK